MGRRSSAKHEWASQPGRLVIHDDPYDIWAKLNWEANEFHLHQTGDRPIDVDGLVYLLQNACISAVAVVEWLKLHAKQKVREGLGQFDDARFEATVEQELPHIKLARAIANTFKHGEYRDEGWGQAEVRLETVFDVEQHERLEAAHGTSRFQEVYAEESLEADYRLTFKRNGALEEIEAEAFVLSLAHGALRLLDSCWGDLLVFQE